MQPWPQQSKCNNNTNNNSAEFRISVREFLKQLRMTLKLISVRLTDLWEHHTSLFYIKISDLNSRSYITVKLLSEDTQYVCA